MGIVKKELVGSNIRCLINSTNILETIYNPEKKSLVITFKGGRVYEYKNVSLETYNKFELSESHGKSFHELFKSAAATRLNDIDSTNLILEFITRA